MKTFNEITKLLAEVIVREARLQEEVEQLLAVYAGLARDQGRAEHDRQMMKETERVHVRFLAALDQLKAAREDIAHTEP